MNKKPTRKLYAGIETTRSRLDICIESYQGKFRFFHYTHDRRQFEKIIYQVGIQYHFILAGAPNIDSDFTVYLQEAGCPVTKLDGIEVNKFMSEQLRMNPEAVGKQYCEWICRYGIENHPAPNRIEIVQGRVNELDKLINEHNDTIL